MSSFTEAQKVVAAHEGGYANVPEDLGGPTMWGWSALTLRRLGLTPDKCGIPPDKVVRVLPLHPQVAVWEREDGKVSAWGDWTCVRWMPRYVSDQLFCAEFWVKGRFAEVQDQTAATKLYDFAVNAGPATSWRVAQRAAGLPLNACDGVPGAQSLAAVNALGPGFVRAMAGAMTEYYEGIIKARPANAKFRANWLARAQWGVK